MDEVEDNREEVEEVAKEHNENNLDRISTYGRNTRIWTGN